MKEREDHPAEEDPGHGYGEQHSFLAMHSQEMQLLAESQVIGIGAC